MLHTRRILSTTFLAITALTGRVPFAHAAGHGGSHGSEKAPDIEETVEGVEVTLKLDLGNIEVVNVEPTRGRTMRMSFDLNLMLDPKAELAEIESLDEWHHRLREQVIVGVRATEIYDFIDPELKRFRKRMIYRINRLLGKPIVNDVLLANFTFFSE